MRNQAATSRFRSKSFLITIAVIFMVLLGVVYTVSFIYAATPSQKQNNGAAQMGDAVSGLNNNDATPNVPTSDQASTEDFKSPNSNDDTLHIPQDHKELKKDLENITNEFDNEHFSEEEKEELQKKLEAELAAKQLEAKNKAAVTTGDDHKTQQKNEVSDEYGSTPKLQDRAHAAPITVGIVDEHNDVLAFWLRAAKQNIIPADGKGLPLVHVDSHSDMAMPDTLERFPMLHKVSPSTIKRQPIIAKTNIGNFIPAAVYMRLVDGGQMAWVRSNWEQQQYNLHFGQHRGTMGNRVGTKDELRESKKPFLCASGITPTGSDTLEDIIGYYGGLCNVTTEKVENTVPLVLDVLSLENAVTELPKSFGPNNKKQPYILDIDEDFFASTNPVLNSMVPFSEYGALFTLLERLLSKEEVCHNNEPVKLALIQGVVYDIFWNNLSFMPGSKVTDEPKFKEIAEHYRPEVMQFWCKGPEAAHKTLVHITQLAGIIMQNMDYVTLAMLKMEFQFPSMNCKNNGIFGACFTGDPVNANPPKAVILTQMAKLKQLIEKLGHPALITIARSSEGYTPAHLQGFIEVELLKMLRETIELHPSNPHPLEVSYYDELSPAKVSRKGDPFQVKEKEIDALYKKMSAIKSKEMDAYIESRKTALRNIDLIHKFMSERGLKHIHHVLVAFKEFKVWKAQQPKNAAANKSKKDGKDKDTKKTGKSKNEVDVNEKEAKATIAPNFCYRISAVRSDPSLQKLKCIVRALRKKYNEELSDKGERVNVDIHVSSTTKNFQAQLKTVKQTLKQEISSVEISKKIDEHESSPFVYEEEGCKVEKSKYIGGTNDFVTLVKQRHAEVADSC